MRPDERQFLRDTQASEEAVERVMRRLGQTQDREIDLKTLLAQLPAPSPHAAQRIRNRLLLGPDRSQARPRLWIAGAVAASLLLVWRFSDRSVSETGTDPGIVTVQETPVASLEAGTVQTEAEAAPMALAMDLVNSEALDFTPVPGLTLQVQGTGRLEGSHASPTVQWTSGVLDLEVDPEADLEVSVHTSDGRVTVLGTVFRVERSPLGTAVNLHRGTVQIDCADGMTHSLVGEGSAVCLPATGPGMLGRAHALHGDSIAVLGALERGHRLASDPAIVAELWALQVETLGDLERNSEALEAARSYLEIGGPRELEISRTAAVLALLEEDCPGAIPFLERIAPTQPDAARYLDECKARTRTNTSR